MPTTPKKKSGKPTTKPKRATSRRRTTKGKGINIEVHIGSHNAATPRLRRKGLATKQGLSGNTPLNSIVQVPAPYQNSAFMQTHGQPPEPAKTPVKTETEAITPLKEKPQEIVPILPIIKEEEPNPLLNQNVFDVKSVLKPLPKEKAWDIPFNENPVTKDRPKLTSPTKTPMTRSEALLSMATSPAKIPKLELVTPKRTVSTQETATSAAKIDYSQKITIANIRAFAKAKLGYSKTSANALTTGGDKAHFIREYGQEIMDYMNE